ncbi:hypothetical protein SAY87_028113 [Trapa incisa]|uniref:Tetrahydrofolate dehydrogenase/cyclohydrolase NAD(P)-binding domain-containing protein n=1 Tax=Trapa incisa TaxID=236973 RepID=A0AAN7KV21_9MYRT|nr:hypothetical protein SAY87_028113 [Trapa incisa]
MYAAEAGIGTFESSRCPGSRRALGNEKNVREKKRVEWKLEGENNYFDDGDVQAKVGKIYAIYKKLLSHVLSGRGSMQLNPRLHLQDKLGAIIIDVGTLPVEVNHLTMILLSFSMSTENESLHQCYLHILLILLSGIVTQDGPKMDLAEKFYCIYHRHLDFNRYDANLESEMNLLDPESEQYLLGDVCYEEDVKVAAVITPVPGGVGPVAVSMLLSNTPDAAMICGSSTMPEGPSMAPEEARNLPPP